MAMPLTLCDVPPLMTVSSSRSILSHIHAATFFTENSLSFISETSLFLSKITFRGV